MTELVRTVLGDIPPDELGATDYHEHLFQISPLLPGDELDDEELSGREAASLRGAGIDAMVDATPTGLWRHPEATARISAASGLRVVMATGAHREAHYPEEHWIRSLTAAELERRFTADLLDAVPAHDGADRGREALGPSGEPVRAGLLKSGVGYWSISPFERTVLTAVAGAHVRTGAPVMVHLEYGSAAFEVLELLAGMGVPPGRVVLAHADRNPDPGLHAELAAAGAYLGYDGMARSRNRTDSELIRCLVEAAARGAAGRILLGGDVARRTRYTAYGGMPGLAYLPRRFVPRLRAEAGDELVDRVLRANPARLLTWG
ncbi:phosphotriesterase [Microtetraspora sp. NBRC 13810]|uniref:phosphotriesterase family protein n=1 Tax=Microtetraspora sp. NBRC 13810 TaxID=3030990 RepID=UPI0024A2A3CD|nr:hypothetical protein [Microtetraspora sp. NBRC 13810]GLW07077.1 phosphotriesterase [Microtetraspora sp. NBRC 13810]